MTWMMLCIIDVLCQEDLGIWQAEVELMHVYWLKVDPILGLILHPCYQARVHV